MGFLTEHKKNRLNEFTKFVKDHLEIVNIPKIIIQNGREGLKTTANYDYTKDEKIVKINGKGRALVDIMRSLAHELVHHKQFEEGRLKIKPADIGGEIEDEANAVAGQLIKLFAKNNQTIYDEDLDEQEMPGGDKKSGYPEVSKWSDVVPITRGPGNQIVNTKWSDTVGSQLKRGPANQLK
jgi:hypothetical protein